MKSHQQRIRNRKHKQKVEENTDKKYGITISINTQNVNFENYEKRENKYK